MNIFYKILLFAALVVGCASFAMERDEVISIVDISGNKTHLNSPLLSQYCTHIREQIQDGFAGELDYSGLDKQLQHFLTVQNFKILEAILTHYNERISQVRPINTYTACPVCNCSCECDYHQQTHELRDAYHIFERYFKTYENEHLIPNLFLLVRYLGVENPLLKVMAHLCYDYIGSMAYNHEDQQLAAYYINLRNDCLDYIACYQSLEQFIRSVTGVDQNLLLSHDMTGKKLDLSAKHLNKRGIFCKILNVDDFAYLLDNWQRGQSRLRDLLDGGSTINISGQAISELNTLFPKCVKLDVSQNRITAMSPIVLSEFAHARHDKLDVSHNYLSTFDTISAFPIWSRMVGTTLDISNNLFSQREKERIKREFAKAHNISPLKDRLINPLHASRYICGPALLVGAGALGCAVTDKCLSALLHPLWQINEKPWYLKLLLFASKEVVPLWLPGLLGWRAEKILNYLGKKIDAKKLDIELRPKLPL